MNNNLGDTHLDHTSISDCDDHTAQFCPNVLRHYRRDHARYDRGYVDYGHGYAGYDRGYGDYGHGDCDRGYAGYDRGRDDDGDYSHQMVLAVSTVKTLLIRKLIQNSGWSQMIFSFDCYVRSYKSYKKEQYE